MFEKSSLEEIPSLSPDSVAGNGAAFNEPLEVSDAPVSQIAKESSVDHLPAKPLSVLSPSVVVKGEISAGDEIVIHGTVEGTIAHDMKKVVVGKEGRVRALIHANVVSVEGHVDGDIHGNELVELLASAKVEGDIFCSEIRMEKGARFNGTVNMAPLSG